MISQKLKFQTSFFFQNSKVFFKNLNFGQLQFRQSDLQLPFGNTLIFMLWLHGLKIGADCRFCANFQQKSGKCAESLWTNCSLHRFGA